MSESLATERAMLEQVQRELADFKRRVRELTQRRAVEDMGLSVEVANELLTELGIDPLGPPPEQAEYVCASYDVRLTMRVHVDGPTSANDPIETWAQGKIRELIRPAAVRDMVDGDLYREIQPHIDTLQVREIERRDITF